jgi:predicted aspartyl protease
MVGEVRVKVKLTNAMDEALARRGKIKEEEIRNYEADALVDTGAVSSVIPAQVMGNLGVLARGQRVAQYADGRNEVVDLTEPITFDINGRITSEGAMVLGDEVTIGQTVLEVLDLWVDCNQQRVIPNPAHLDQPIVKVK